MAEAVGEKRETVKAWLQNGEESYKKTNSKKGYGKTVASKDLRGKLAELVKEGIDARPEIMVPLVGHHEELTNQRRIIETAYEEVKQSRVHTVHRAVKPPTSA